MLISVVVYLVVESPIAVVEKALLGKTRAKQTTSEFQSSTHTVFGNFIFLDFFRIFLYVLFSLISTILRKAYASSSPHTVHFTN